MLYFDANAAARIRPAAMNAVSGILHSEFALGNPSSVHSAGRNARGHIDQARQAVLRYLFGEEKFSPQLFFTSSGTESCNTMVLSLLGQRECLGEHPGHIVTTAIEHPAVLEPIENLEKAKWSVTRILPNQSGIVVADEVREALESHTALVAIMAANNETGARQPICQIAQALRKNGYSGIIASDITQAVSKSDLDLRELFRAGVDIVAFSGHKLGALPGVGVVVLNPEGGRCYQFYSLLQGGSQETYYRAGTENLQAIVSLGAVCEHLVEHGKKEREHVTKCLYLLIQLLRDTVPDLERLTPDESMSNTLSVRFPGIRGDDFVVACDLQGLCVGTGAACSSGRQQPSHVLLAMGFSSAQAREVIRFSLDWDITENQVRRAVEIIRGVVARMRPAEIPAGSARQETQCSN